MLLRIYIRGITDGFGFYNAVLEKRGQQPLLCPPRKLGLVDAQYVAILDSFLKKKPTLGSYAPPAVLQDQFPCAQ